MRNEPLHPQKPVMVEHVTDDIRALRESTGEQQKKLLSSRALADFLAGDTFHDGHESDAGYYVSIGVGAQRKVDFDKVVDSSIRFAEADTYINGPENVTFSGFLHTLTVLPTGSLVYANHGADVLCTRPFTKNTIRQIFYPHDNRDFDAYTRVGSYDYTTRTWNFTRWVLLSGKLLRIKVTTNDSPVIRTENLRENTIYELHCNGGTIMLPDPDAMTVGSKIVFEQYSNNQARYVESGVDTSRTPLPVPSNQIRYFLKKTVSGKDIYYPAGTNNGWLTAFTPGEKYYIMASPSAWTSIVQFAEWFPTETTDSETGKPVLEKRTYEVNMTPSLDTIRASEGGVDSDSGEWFENNAQAVSFTFEVVDRGTAIELDGGKVSNYTWIMDVDPEAATKMADMAELLDAHTDKAIDDLVMYEQRQFKGSNHGTGSDGNVSTGSQQYIDFVPCNDEPLVVSRPAGTEGFVKFSISGNPNGSPDDRTWHEALSDYGFEIAVYKFNEFAEGFKTGTFFKFELANEAEPNPYKRYWVRDSVGAYSMAGTAGYLDVFAFFVTEDDAPETGKTYYMIVGGKYVIHTGAFVEGTTYYERSAYYTRSVDYGTSGITPAKFRFNIDNFTAEHEAKFLSADGEFSRDATTSDTGDSIWDIYDPFEGFIKVSRNDTIMIVIKSSKHTDTMRMVTPRISFYPDQHSQYVLKPNVTHNEILAEELEKLAATESREVILASAASVIRAYETLARQLQGRGQLFAALPFTTDANALTTTGVYTASGNVLNNIPTGASTVPISGEVATNALLMVFDSKAYAPDTLLDENGVDVSDGSHKRVTQIFIGNGPDVGSSAQNACPRMWIRFYDQKSGTANWSKWVQLMQAPVTVDYRNKETVTEAEMVAALTNGSPNVVVGRNVNEVTINLPSNPARYPNTKFQIEAQGCKVHIKYGSYQYDNDTIKGSSTDVSRMLYPIECDGSSWFVVIVS